MKTENLLKRWHLTRPLTAKMNPTEHWTRLLHDYRWVPEADQSAFRFGQQVSPHTSERSVMWKAISADLIKVIKHWFRIKTAKSLLASPTCFSKGWNMQKGDQWPNIIPLHAPLPILYREIWLYIENIAVDQALVSKAIQINSIFVVFN